jgi:hypothetical protein
MHTYIHTYVYTYIHTYIRIYIHACMHACMHAYIHACIHIYTHTNTHTHTQMCVCVCVCVCVLVDLRYCQAHGPYCAIEYTLLLYYILYYTFIGPLARFTYSSCISYIIYTYMYMYIYACICHIAGEAGSSQPCRYLHTYIYVWIHTYRGLGSRVRSNT